jgi:hypothetical protein
MNFSRSVAKAALVGMILTVTGLAAPVGHASMSEARGDSSIPAAGESGMFLECLICVYVNGTHAFVLTSDIACDSPEERAVNNCSACGGSSECHEAPQTGSCHAACAETMPEEFRQLAERGDLAALARLSNDFNRRSRTAARVEVNVARSALQAFNCNGTVSEQVLLSRVQLAELSRLLIPKSSDAKGARGAMG